MGWRVLVLGMAAALSAGAADEEWDRIVLLQKAKRHVAEAAKRLPDYTCLETSARYRKNSAKEQERLVDTVVLEVLNSAEKELYASPGERDFHSESPNSFVGHGMSGTGAFGLFLRTLFVNDVGQFQWGGDEQASGRKVLKWNYRVPITSSGYTITHSYFHGRVAMRGWMWIDAETLDIVRLVVDADEIPPNLPITEGRQVIDYALTRIGDRDVVLPQTATIRLVEETGGASRNDIAFTHCQSFQVESTLSFTAVDTGPATTARPAEEVRPVAEGLPLTIELAGPVTEKHVVGTLIEAKVAADVRERGRVAIRAGSAVRGRVRRLEREGDHWIVGLEFTDVETEAGPARFYANIQDLDKASGATFFWKVSKKEELSLSYLPGVAHFYAPSLPLPKGFKTVWKTTSPRSASR
jgi:hypothetical protein